jgi:hypothetical protein
MSYQQAAPGQKSGSRTGRIAPQRQGGLGVDPYKTPGRQTRLSETDELGIPWYDGTISTYLSRKLYSYPEPVCSKVSWLVAGGAELSQE